jgi:hypothetical protein
MDEGSEAQKSMVCEVRTTVGFKKGGFYVVMYPSEIIVLANLTNPFGV